MKIETETAVARRICSLMHAERKFNKISQQVLCKELGITQGLLSKIENGKLKPSVYSWLAFCQLFGLKSDIALSENQYRKKMSQLKKTK